MRIALLIVALLLTGCTAPSPGGDGNVTSTPGSTTPPAGPTDGTGSSGSPPTSPPAPPGPGTGTRPGQGRFAGCSGEGPVTFNVSPMRDEDFVNLLPYGLIVGAHVTPIDHMYFSPPHGSARDAFEVRAIADGVIYSVQPRDINVDTGEGKAREWRLDIAHTCTFTSYFDLITSLDPLLEAEYNKTRGGRAGPWSGIPVKAGQLVGRIGAQTLDFGVYDYNVTLPGFVVPAHYAHEPWKVHTVDPFPYFEEPLRSALLAKMLRQVEPRAGTIDHDVDGTAAGNWFLVGTNGYAGIDPRRYWDGHLSLPTDAIDPTQLRFSIGNWSGDEAQFGVKGNAPAWRSIDTTTGIVKVELMYYTHMDRASGRMGMGPGGVRPGDDVVGVNMGDVRGVALLQLVGPRLLKVEVFPGSTAAQVEGFTDAAKLYER